MNKNFQDRFFQGVDFPLDKVITFLTRGKKSFKIEDSGFKIGSIADFTFFSPKGTSTLEKAHIHSSSKNCLFLDSTIKGTVYGSIRGKSIQYNN